MNDDQYGDLHAWIEPEIEARLVALVLGEASDFEADELRRLMEERPELRMFKQRLESVHGLLGAAVKPDDDADWRLSGKRRGDLLEAFGVEVEEEVEALPIVDEGQERRVRKQARRVAVMVAACLMVAVVLTPLFFSAGAKLSEKSVKGRLLNASNRRDDYVTADLQMEEAPIVEHLFGNISKAETEGERLSRSLATFDAPASRVTDGRESESVSGGLAALKKTMSLVSEAAPETNLRAATGVVGYETLTDENAAGSDLMGLRLADVDREAKPVPATAKPAPTAAPVNRGESVIPAYVVVPKTPPNTEPSSGMATRIAGSAGAPEEVVIAGMVTAGEQLTEGINVAGGLMFDDTVVDESVAHYSKAFRKQVPTLRGLDGKQESRGFGENKVATNADGGATWLDRRDHGTDDAFGSVMEDGKRPKMQLRHGAEVGEAARELDLTVEVAGSLFESGLAVGAGTTSRRGKVTTKFVDVGQANEREKDFDWIGDRKELGELTFSGVVDEEPEGVEFEGFVDTNGAGGQKMRSLALGLGAPEADFDVDGFDADENQTVYYGRLQGLQLGSSMTSNGVVVDREFLYPTEYDPPEVANGVVAGRHTAFYRTVVPDGADEKSGAEKAGLLSGDSAITRNSIDGILNNPDRDWERQYKSGAVNIEGNVKTKDRVIRRELPALPGARFSVLKDKEEVADSGAEKAGRRFEDGALLGKHVAGYVNGPTDKVAKSERGSGKGSLHWSFGSNGDDVPAAARADTVSFALADIDGEKRGQAMRYRSADLDGDDVVFNGGAMLEGFQSESKPKGSYAWRSKGESDQLRTLAVRGESEALLLEGRKAYSEGDYDGAVDKYAESLSKLSEDQSEDVRRLIENHLADGSVALAQVHRREGNIDEAKKVLDKVLQRDPGNALAKQHWDYLEDPVRTNPGLDYEHTENVDKVRRKLYTGEGLYNLGRFDEAMDQFEETLRVDPYNTAARKWMEKIDSAKSDYYRAANDETRSRMLAEVDEAWELSVPPAPGQGVVRTNGKLLEAQKELAWGGKKNEELLAQEKLVEEKRKVLDTIVQAIGIPYVESVAGSGEGRSQEVLYELSERQLYEQETERDQLEHKINALTKLEGEEQLKYAAGLNLPQNGVTPLYTEVVESKRELAALEASGLGADHPDVAMWRLTLEQQNKDLEKSTAALQEILKTQKELVDGRLSRMRDTRNRRRDDAVDRSLESHDYVEAKREYENAQGMLQSLKLKQASDAVALKIKAGGLGGGGGAVTRTWRVSPDFMRQMATLEGQSAASDDPFSDAGGGSGLMARRPVAELFKEQGISFPEGAAVSYDEGTGTLVVTNTEESLALMGDLVDEIAAVQVADISGLVERVDAPNIDSGKIRATNEKLRNIIIPVVDFETTTVEEALDFLRQRSRELDTNELDGGTRGLGFEVRNARVEGGFDDALDTDLGLGGGGAPGSATIKELKLRNVPVATVLQYVADQTGMRYKVEGDGNVVMLPASSGEGEDPITRVWKLHPDVLKELEDGAAPSSGQDDPFGDDVAQREEDEELMTLMDVMKNYGVTFPEGTKVNYLAESQTLVVMNTPSNMDLVEVLLESSAERVASGKHSQKMAEEQNEKSAAEEAFSTFSLHVSDVSFKLAQAALAKGEWPEADRIRVEEFVNALDYGDPSPTPSEKVACRVEQAAHPFMQQRNVMRIAMRTAAVGRASGTPLRLTILLDNSGSMERPDRAQSVRNAFGLLLDQLNPEDEVTLISFARTPHLLRDGVSGDQAQDLLRAIDERPSEGGTNLEEALRLGMEKATEHHLEGAQNRVILLTDGAANLGDAKPERLKGLVETLRQRGIAFDACGVGADGLNDDILEALTRKGDGRYYFLDRPEDADAGFAKQIAGALRPAAKNVKVQVEFNPKRVGHYALYGFEKHELKKEDFRNDSVDAAEMAAEEAGVAMYHVETLPDGEGDVGTVSVRFQDMETGEMVEKLWPIPYEQNPAALEDAAPSMKLAASAALLGEALKGSAVGDLVEMGMLSKVTRSLQTVYPENERVGHLIEMVEKVREMGR